MTVFFNGVLVQDDFALRGETVFIGTPAYMKHGDSPIKLQAHNDPSASPKLSAIFGCASLP